ncbi:hypothetical protein E3Q23_01033, partial [Wallemia mellicola]
VKKATPQSNKTRAGSDLHLFLEKLRQSSNAWSLFACTGDGNIKSVDEGENNVRDCFRYLDPTSTQFAIIKLTRFTMEDILLVRLYGENTNNIQRSGFDDVLNNNSNHITSTEDIRVTSPRELQEFVESHLPYSANELCVDNALRKLSSLHIRNDIPHIDLVNGMVALTKNNEIVYREPQDVQVGDRILSHRPQDNCCYWQKVFAFEHIHLQAEDLIHVANLEAGESDMSKDYGITFTTPRYERVPCVTETNDKYFKSYTMETLEDIVVDKCIFQYRSPGGISSTNDIPEDLSNYLGLKTFEKKIAFLELVGMFIGDGHINLSLSYINFKHYKAEDTVYLTNIGKCLGLHYTTTSDLSETFPPNTFCKLRSFRIYTPQYVSYFQHQFNRPRDGRPSRSEVIKDIPTYLINTNRTYCQALLKGLHQADGQVYQNKIYGSEKVPFKVYVTAILAGFSPRNVLQSEEGPTEVMGLPGTATRDLYGTSWLDKKVVYTYRSQFVEDKMVSESTLGLRGIRLYLNQPNVYVSTLNRVIGSNSVEKVSTIERPVLLGCDTKNLHDEESQGYVIDMKKSVDMLQFGYNATAPMRHKQHVTALSLAKNDDAQLSLEELFNPSRLVLPDEFADLEGLEGFCDNDEQSAFLVKCKSFISKEIRILLAKADIKPLGSNQEEFKRLRRSFTRDFTYQCGRYGCTVTGWPRSLDKLTVVAYSTSQCYQMARHLLFRRLEIRRITPFDSKSLIRPYISLHTNKKTDALEGEDLDDGIGVDDDGVPCFKTSDIRNEELINVEARQCNLCLKTFPSEAALQTHYYFSTTGPIPCDQCNHKFHTKKHLESHKGHIHGIMRVSICEQCGLTFLELDQLLDHYCSVSIGNLACTVNNCQHRFKSIEDLQIHIKICHKKRQKRFLCTCGYEVDSLYTFENHFRRFAENNHKLKCPFCPHNFPSHGARGSHITTIHSEDAQSVYYDVRKNEYISVGDTGSTETQLLRNGNPCYQVLKSCESCEFTGTDTELQEHYAIVGDPKNLEICAICQHRFPDAMWVTMHRDIDHHNVVENTPQDLEISAPVDPPREEAPYAIPTSNGSFRCSICRYEDGEDKVNHHINISSITVGKKLHLCKLCTHTFRLPGTYARHVIRDHEKEWSALPHKGEMIATGTRTYKENLQIFYCSECGCSGIKSSIQVHLVVSNAIATPVFRCPFCRHSFNSSVSQSLHITKFHRDQYNASQNLVLIEKYGCGIELTTKGPFKCQKCKRVDGLRQAIVVHIAETARPDNLQDRKSGFKCQYDSHWFKNKAQFTKHIRNFCYKGTREGPNETIQRKQCPVLFREETRGYFIKDDDLKVCSVCAFKGDNESFQLHLELTQVTSRDKDTRHGCGYCSHTFKCENDRFWHEVSIHPYDVM